MPLRLDVKRKLTARSDRVKSVDLHPTEPWMLASLYNGHVHVWNIESQQLVKSFEVCDLPVRAARFVARKNWVVTGSDDMQLRVFNYNTLERVHQFEAHSDYVRCIAVHPTQPFILTCSDDMTIKLWNWDKKWSCQQVFEGHSHYVMQIVINPKDNNTFASASLDRTVKVWQLGSPQPNFTLEGHQRGVNCVDYYHGGDKPYLISGADDYLVKIWDYQNKTCVQTLEGHSQNVSAVSFHPELPIILTGSEDCTVRVWHVNTYRLENTLNYGLDRVWCISALKGSNNVCFGYDEGSVMIKLGREEPAMSMDVSGKIVWARHSEIQQANLKAMADTEIQDGERLPLAIKDLGACDIYPQTIAHNPNGRFVVVCGDGEYIIYTAMALRNKAFGPALEFVWALDSSEYAIRESNFNVKLFKNFKEKKSFKPEFGSEAIFGGYLLGCRSSATGLAFYDWETQELVRRIEIQPRQVFWSENGDYVCIATDENYFILKYSTEAVTNARDTKEGVTEDGIEDAFDLVGEVQEIVKTGKWVGDCFIYTNSVNRLNYYVGGEIVTIAHLDRTLYLIGYIPKENRLYLGDKELNVVSYELLVSVLEYQTAVMRRDFDTADRVLPTIPSAHRTRVAHFLEKQGFKKQALAVSTDPEHRFDLALSLGELEVCHQLAVEAGSEHKWRLVADLAQQQGDLEMAQKCLLRAHDYPGLLLQATSTGNARLIQEVGREAEDQGRNNVAFLSYFLTGNMKECLELLIKTNRVPEAAFFARTYLPNEMSRVVGLWKEAAGEKIGQSLADPAQYDNLFPSLKEAVKTQHFLEKQAKPIPAASAASVSGNHERNPTEEMRAAEAAGTFVYSPPEGDDSSQFVDAPSPSDDLLQAQSLTEDNSLLTPSPVPPVASAPSSPSEPPPMSVEPLVPTAAITPPSTSPVPDSTQDGTSLIDKEEEIVTVLDTSPPGNETELLGKEPFISTNSPSAPEIEELGMGEGEESPPKVVDESGPKDWEDEEDFTQGLSPTTKLVEEEPKDKDDWGSDEENLFESEDRLSPSLPTPEAEMGKEASENPKAGLEVEDILGLGDDEDDEVAILDSKAGAAKKFPDWDEDEAEDWGLDPKSSLDQFSDCLEEVSLRPHRETRTLESTRYNLHGAKKLSSPGLVMSLPAFASTPLQGMHPMTENDDIVPLESGASSIANLPPKALDEGPVFAEFSPNAFSPPQKEVDIPPLKTANIFSFNDDTYPPNEDICLKSDISLTRNDLPASKGDFPEPSGEIVTPIKCAPASPDVFPLEDHAHSTLGLLSQQFEGFPPMSDSPTMFDNAPSGSAKRPLTLDCTPVKSAIPPCDSSPKSDIAPLFDWPSDTELLPEECSPLKLDKSPKKPLEVQSELTFHKFDRAPLKSGMDPQLQDRVTLKADKLPQMIEQVPALSSMPPIVFDLGPSEVNVLPQNFGGDPQRANLPSRMFDVALPKSDRPLQGYDIDPSDTEMPPQNFDLTSPQRDLLPQNIDLDPPQRDLLPQNIDFDPPKIDILPLRSDVIRPNPVIPPKSHPSEPDFPPYMFGVVPHEIDMPPSKFDSSLARPDKPTADFEDANDVLPSSRFNKAFPSSMKTRFLESQSDPFDFESNQMDPTAQPLEASAPPLNKLYNMKSTPLKVSDCASVLAKQSLEFEKFSPEPAARVSEDSPGNPFSESTSTSSSSWCHFERGPVASARDNRVKQRKPCVGSSARPTIDQAQLERELELDLENVRIDDNIDPNDVNLDEEDLLAD